MDSINEIFDCLPDKVKSAVAGVKQNKSINDLTEIRLRAGNLQSLVIGGEELPISALGYCGKRISDPLQLTGNDLAEIVFRLCDGSVYAHFEEIKNGYISKNGIRIGLCGTGVIKNGVPSGFSSYSSLNIRIPRYIKNSADTILDYINKKGSSNTGGILVISPPGGGKTTFLRSLASALSHGYMDAGRLCRKRVCVIDERKELFLKEAFSKGLCDFISCLPKAYSIELATRVLSPEYIICDEIGNESDAMAISEGATKGVCFVASCHGKGVEDVFCKKSVRRLFEDKVFLTACVLSCKNGKYETTVESVFDDGESRC